MKKEEIWEITLPVYFRDSKGILSYDNSARKRKDIGESSIAMLKEYTGFPRTRGWMHFYSKERNAKRV